MLKKLARLFEKKEYTPEECVAKLVTEIMSITTIDNRVDVLKEVVQTVLPMHRVYLHHPCKRKPKKEKANESRVEATHNA